MIFYPMSTNRSAAPRSGKNDPLQREDVKKTIEALLAATMLAIIAQGIPGAGRR
jgi:hypothetical protein